MTVYSGSITLNLVHKRYYYLLLRLMFCGSTGGRGEKRVVMTVYSPDSTIGGITLPYHFDTNLSIDQENFNFFFFFCQSRTLIRFAQPKKKKSQGKEFTRRGKLIKILFQTPRGVRLCILIFTKRRGRNVESRII